MKGIVDWSARHPSMIITMVILVFSMGVLSYINLPKEGAPDIVIPNYFISVSFPGISAEDSENFLLSHLRTNYKMLTVSKARQRQLKLCRGHLSLILVLIAPGMGHKGKS